MSVVISVPMREAAETASCDGQQGRDSRKGTCSAELSFLVKVHEQIKGIEQLADEVSVAAMNASLAARGGEVACVGYRAVAAELRQFSMRLTGDMARLEKVIAKEVHVAARLQQMRHRSRLLCLAAKANARLGARVATVRSQMDAISIQSAAGLKDIWMSLEGTRIQCRAGRVAARTALFEAAHAGAKAPSMTEAARGIDALVAKLEERATSVGISLAGACR